MDHPLQVNFERGLLDGHIKKTNKYSDDFPGMATKDAMPSRVTKARPCFASEPLRRFQLGMKQLDVHQKAKAQGRQQAFARGPLSPAALENAV